MLFVEFLHPKGGSNTLGQLSRHVLIAIALLLYLVLKLAIEDMAVQDCLHLIVLFVVHDHWWWQRVCPLT